MMTHTVKSLDVCDIDGQPEIAISMSSGNGFIFETMTNSIKIPMANFELSTTARL